MSERQDDLYWEDAIMRRQTEAAAKDLAIENERLTAALAAAEARCAALVEAGNAMRRHVVHERYTCELEDDCACGLDATLERWRAAAGGVV